jgi:hypothetical protein
MDNGKAKLETSVKVHLAPVLRGEGFKGSGRNYRRVVGDLIQALNVQGSRYDGQFAINMGIQPIAIPDVLGSQVEPMKMTEPYCEFRRRLSETGGDQWWSHTDTQESMDQAVKVATSVYANVGRALFAAMSGPSCPLHTVTPAQFAADTFTFHGFGSTNTRMAFALARLRKAQNRPEECGAFADIALRDIGRGFALIEELEGLRAWAQQSVPGHPPASRGVP